MQINFNLDSIYSSSFSSSKDYKKTKSKLNRD